MDTTPRRDGFKYQLFKQAGGQLSNASPNQLCVRLGRLPKEWKHSVIIPIFKPVKEPVNPSS